MGRSVAVVGATGAVGTEMLKVLEKRAFPVDRIRLLASARSKGRKLRFRGEEVEVEELTSESFKGVELALFSAGGERSREFAPAAAAAGAVVVDNSSAFRMDPGTPLVVPEVNPDDVKGHKGIIANPNCSTIIMVVPVWPLHRGNRVRRIVCSTYQAASGAGATAMQELIDQSGDVLAGRPAEPRVFPHPIAFNLFSHNSSLDEEGYNTEEMKMVDETRKMFHDDDIAVCVTCVRVGVLRAHSEALNIEFEDPITAEEVRETLREAPGVRVVDDRERNHFPMPLEAAEHDEVLVGRIRRDISLPDGRGIAMFISGDQLLKGAALNAVQIAELL